MRPYVEYILEDGGIRVADNVVFAPDVMSDHAHDALANEAVQVTFVDQDGRETVFARDA